MEVVRKTYQERLRPTPAQERELDHVLWRHDHVSESERCADYADLRLPLEDRMH